MKSLLLILLLLGPVLPLMAQENITNPGLCKQLVEARQQMQEQNLPGLNSARFQLLLQKLFPSLSFRLNEIGEPLPSGKKGPTGRNLIVAFGVPSTDAGQREEFESAQREMKRQIKLFLKIYKQKTPEACVARAESIGFDARKFFELQTRISEMKEQQRNREYHEVMKRYQKLPGRLQDLWPIKTGFHAAELKELLNQNKIDHLIIVAHANDKGHMTDSFENYLPSGLFQGLSSKLKTLSIFTCHGKKVVEFYGLSKDKNLKLFYPEAKSPLLSDVTLLPALPSFVKQVTKELGPINIKKSPLNESCKLEILAGAIEGEEISFLLGDKYLVGNYRKGQSISYNFDCSLLHDENMISVRSLRSKAVLKLSEEWKLNLQTPEGRIEPELVEHFGENMSYQGSLFFIP